MNDKKIGNCTHYVFTQDGSVCITNDDDGHYATEFNSREEVEAFITELKEAADEVFN